jgi:hypothetical protein
MRAETCGNRWRRECGTEEICTRKERLALAVQASDQEVIPQWVKLGSAVVHDLGKVCVEILGVQVVVGRGVVFADIEGS